MHRFLATLTLSTAAIGLMACSPRPAEPADAAVEVADISAPTPAAAGETPTDPSAPSTQEAPQGTQTTPDRRAGRGERMDGPMTLADMQARFDRRFDRMDANGDGVLSGDELQPAQGGERGQGGRGGGRMIERADVDNDGRITRTEMRAGAEAMFRAQDANNDGQITAEERPQRGGGAPR